MHIICQYNACMCMQCHGNMHARLNYSLKIVLHDLHALHSVTDTHAAVPSTEPDFSARDLMDTDHMDPMTEPQSTRYVYHIHNVIPTKCLPLFVWQYACMHAWLDFAWADPVLYESYSTCTYTVYTSEHAYNKSVRGQAVCLYNVWFIHHSAILCMYFHSYIHHIIYYCSI